MKDSQRARSVALSSARPDTDIRYSADRDARTTTTDNDGPADVPTDRWISLDQSTTRSLRSRGGGGDGGDGGDGGSGGGGRSESRTHRTVNGLRLAGPWTSPRAADVTVGAVYAMTVASDSL